MSTKWSDRSFGDEASEDAEGGVLPDDEIVVLMQGKNVFGDRIYSYVKLTVEKFRQMRGLVRSGQNCNPTDFGEIIAAGKGDPSDELRAEMALTYNMVDIPQPKPATPAAPPPQPKLWDEY